MPSAAKSSSGAAPPAQASWLKTNYLLGYNAISAFSWMSLLWHAGLAARYDGLSAVEPKVDLFWKVTQSLAALEILHSLFGGWSSLCAAIRRGRNGRFGAQEIDLRTVVLTD